MYNSDLPLRIGVLNLEKLSPPNEPVERAAKKKALQEIIFRMNADILGFEELVNENFLTEILEELPDSFIPYKSTIVKTQSAGFGIKSAIVSRFPIDQSNLEPHDNSENFHWTNNDDVDINFTIPWDRPLLELPIQIPLVNNNSTTIRFFVVHLKSKIPTKKSGAGNTWDNLTEYADGAYVSTLRRVGQARYLRRRLDQLFENDPESKIVVMGDFNADLSSATVQTIIGDHLGANNESLRMNELLPCELSLPSEKRFSYIFRGKGIMIDHILISRAQLPYFITASAHNEFLREEHYRPSRPKRFFPEPDHAALFADFNYDVEYT